MGWETERGGWGKERGRERETRISKEKGRQAPFLTREDERREDRMLVCLARWVLAGVALPKVCPYFFCDDCADPKLLLFLFYLFYCSFLQATGRCSCFDVAYATIFLL